MNVSKTEAFQQNSFRTQAKPFYIQSQRGMAIQNSSKSLLKKSISQRSSRRASDTDVIRLTLEKFKQNKAFKERFKQDQAAENYLMQEYINLMDESKGMSKAMMKAKRSEPQVKRIFHEKRLLRTSLLNNNSVVNNEKKIELMNLKLQSPALTATAFHQAKLNHQNTPQSVMRLPSFMVPTTDNTPRFQTKASISRFQSNNTITSQSNPNLYKPVNMQSFNDFYKVPLKQENSKAHSKRRPNYLTIVAVTKKLIKEIRIRKIENQIRPRSSNLSKDLQMMCESFKQRTSLGRLDVIGSKKGSMMAHRQLSKSAFNSVNINDATFSSKNKQDSPDNKNKRTFSEYIKKNLKFSTYYQNLDNSATQTTKSHRPNLVFGHEQDDPEFVGPNDENHPFSHLIKDRTRTVDLLPEMMKHHLQFDIKHVSFRTESCPLNILHKYPVGIKPPYVYEYSSHLHYSSYWMDCIMRLCDEKDLSTVNAFGYYNLRESAVDRDSKRFQEPLRSVLKMTQKLVCDINSEHKIVPMVDNSSLN